MSKYRLADSITEVVINALNYLEQLDSGNQCVSVSDVTSTIDTAYLRYRNDPIFYARVTMLTARILDVCHDMELEENAKLRDELEAVRKAAIYNSKVLNDEISKLREQLSATKAGTDLIRANLNGWKQRAEAAEAKLKALDEKKPEAWIVLISGEYSHIRDTNPADIEDAEEDGQSEVSYVPLYSKPVPPVDVALCSLNGGGLRGAMIAEAILANTGELK